MKLVTITVFGAGYLLGSRAGRERYDQIAGLVRRASEGLDLAHPQERLEAYAGRLEAYASRNGRSAGEPRPRVGS